jgi:hypothetical protein
LVQCNRNIALHNQVSVVPAFFRPELPRKQGDYQRFGAAASFAALLVLSPNSLACSVNTCIWRLI